MRKLLASVVAIGLAALCSAAPVAHAGHVACGDTITQSTTLDSDLLDCADGLVIGADGITLDLGGHTIAARSAPPDPFIDMIGVDNSAAHDGLTVRNGSLSGWELGILLSPRLVFVGPTADAVVRNVRIEGLQGVSAFALTRVVIDGLRTVTDRPSEFFVAQTFSVQIDMTDGVVRDSRFDSLRSFGPPGFEWGADASARLSALRSVVEDNWVRHGQLVVAGHDNLVSRNTVVHGFPEPMNLIGNRNHAEKNTLVGGAAGMFVQGSDIRIDKNTATGNFDANFVIDATSGLVSKNVATGSVRDGIDVRRPGPILAKNTADSNGDYGIQAVPGVVDGGGNKASGNAQPAQCLNIACK